MPSHYGNQTLEWMGVLSGGGQVKTKCKLCNLRLSINEPPNGQDVQAFTILPCGHAFGYDCIKTLFQADHSAQCPSCGASAKHRRCGHLPKFRKMEQKDKNLTFKMVDPDGLPSRCEYCVHYNFKPSTQTTFKKA
ncbi:hypothetical protein HD806DRAFT_527238 [Xylariaceae sp. AK1471]|nr:hypothetical protein HD806DRAFT_527238 [Xylariaceae sp. AK1471]